MSSTTIVPRHTELGQWKCVRPATISASWPELQLLVTNVPRNPLVSANGVQLQLRNSGSPAGDVGSYYTYAGFLVMGNGDGEADWEAASPWHHLLMTTVVGLRASAMDNGGGVPVPGPSQMQIPLLLPSKGEDNGQWSQWKEPLILEIYTVSYLRG